MGSRLQGQYCSYCRGVHNSKRMTIIRTLGMDLFHHGIGENIGRIFLALPLIVSTDHFFLFLHLTGGMAFRIAHEYAWPHSGLGGP